MEILARLMAFIREVLCLRGAARPNTDFASEERHLSVPPALRVSGSVEVIYCQLPETQLRVSVEAPLLLSDVSTSANGQILHINLSRQGKEGRAIVGIASPDLRHLDVRDSASVDISLVGAADLEIRTAGSGKVIADGFAHKLTVNVTDSASFDARQLAADEVECTVTNFGAARLIARSYVSAMAYGNGRVTVFGNPAGRRIDERGSGRVDFSSTAA